MEFSIVCLLAALYGWAIGTALGTVMIGERVPFVSAVFDQLRRPGDAVAVGVLATWGQLRRPADAVAAWLSSRRGH